MKWGLKYLLLVLMLLPPSVYGATIEGRVYDWSTLEPLNNVIVEVNTIPSQTHVVTDGTYSFDILPGTYNLSASYYHNNILDLQTKEVLLVTGEGHFTLDLILFPVDEVEFFFEDNDLSLDEIFVNEESKDPFDRRILIAGFIIVLSLLILRANKRKKTEHHSELPEDLQTLLRILDINQGRMTQLEIRKKMDLSEAKISLMITDLEARGLVKKIKKGRGNVIIRKKPD